MLTLSSLAQRWHDQQEPEPFQVRYQLGHCNNQMKHIINRHNSNARQPQPAKDSKNHSIPTNLHPFSMHKDDCQHGEGVKCMYTITSTFHTCHLYNIA